MSRAAETARFAYGALIVALRRLRRLGLRSLVLIALAPIVALVIAAALEPLPAELEKGPAEPSLRVLDRNGRLIRELRASDGAFGASVTLDEIAPEAVSALLAAEDARFYRHPGIDPIAIARAAGQALVERRIVSGASTITQQLARTLTHRPHTLLGKLHEMAIALRIEASLDKHRILEEYLNRVEFGPNLRGIEAASRFYFDKPARALDLAEAATLAGIPRGPTLYDPRRGTERVERRRNRILKRMRAEKLAPDDAIDRALVEPIRLESAVSEGGAEHLVAALASGALEPTLTAHGRPQEIRSTLDLDLEREVEGLVRQTIARLDRFDATAASVVVVDAPTGEVLAYVGSPDFHSEAALGQNDGARSLRQPGSALKPFVYAAAMHELGMTAATLLPDIELHLATSEGGDYSPRNYDGRFHGPVRLREALASSLNVPAVFVAERTGPTKVLDELHAFGFESLNLAAQHYGAAVALGDGEVRLVELAAAYATLARGGRYRPLRYALGGRLRDGKPLILVPPSERRVIDARLAAVLSDVLSDDAARSASFGAHSVLELPFPVAAKTGTSKNFRDNWAVGFTREVTVAIWVGNFDGRPLRGSSGITGAGPLLHDVLLAAMRGRRPAPLVDRNGLVEVEVCTLSGELAGADCPHRARELFVSSQAPTRTCTMHERIAIDERNALRAGPRCAGRAEHVFERYPPEYAAWASAVGRPTAPHGFSPNCPGSAESGASTPTVTFPFDGARFALDPGLAREQQRIVLTATPSGASGALKFVLDGGVLATVGAPFNVPWRLSPGEHVLFTESADGIASEKVRFVVQ